MLKDEYISICKKRYSYLEEYELDYIFESAKRELFITLYSSNTSAITEETTIPYAYEMKVLDCMFEMIDLGSARNFTSYQENGIRWTRPNTGYKAYQNIKSFAILE